uniref:Putative secreted protein n=1 Tax=Ixodes ricinus TaxID=34613 RepID=A0A6B0UAG3_IXORI
MHASREWLYLINKVSLFVTATFLETRAEYGCFISQLRVDVELRHILCVRRHNRKKSRITFFFKFLSHFATPPKGCNEQIWRNCTTASA